MNNEDKLKRYLAPGIWEDVDGGVHFSVPDLIKLFNLPNTPETEKRVFEMVKDMLKEHAPNSKIYTRDWRLN